MRNIAVRVIRCLLRMVKTPIRVRFLFFQKTMQRKGRGYVFRISTHLTDEEKYLIYTKARRLKENSSILEIGSYLGASSCFLALGALENNSKVYCVDTWKNEGMSEGERDTYQEFLENTKTFDNIKALRGRSQDMGKRFSGKIDMLFLDGNHSYKDVKTDIETWFPHLRDKAIVVFHDIGWAAGVKKAVDEFVKPMVIGEGYLPNMYWAIVKGK